MKLSNLTKRLLFALWAIPLSWFIINTDFSLFELLPQSAQAFLSHNAIPPFYPGHLLIVILIFMGCSEYLNMLSKLYPKNGFWIMYVWLLFQAFSYFLPDKLLLMHQYTYILLLLVAGESFLWGDLNTRWKRASLLFSGICFLMIAGFSLFEFYAQPFQQIFGNRTASPLMSNISITIIVASVFLCDSAAYFIGTWFGKHHFSSISPKKTIEGSIAGLVASTLTIVATWHFMTAGKYPIAVGILLGILIGVFSQIGDLLVSLIKRYFEVKDASNIIPGHGGILDRFDSLFFAAPIINLFVIFLSKILS